ncbi:hypothetical protein JXA34_03000 [Patescibacteria group bacterium]|nr:hypothetical protein [Patescibacteria group bacterium]
MIRFIKKQKGQVLLSVVVAVTVALAVGVSISTRTLSMSSRVSRTDTASRLIAAVEGGAERFLVINDCRLRSFADTTDADRYEQYCDDANMEYVEGIEGCVVNFPPQGDDKIATRAIVTVEEFDYNSAVDDENHYRFVLNAGQMKELPLTDGTHTYGNNEIDVCWDNDNTAIYYVAYDTRGNITRGGFYPRAFVDPLDSMRGFEQASSVSRDGYTWCATIPLAELQNNQYYGLRLRALYDHATFGLYPSPSRSLTSQGYRIVSVGELSEESEEKTVKVVTVYRSYPYLPDVFDYAIFTNGSF